MEYEVRYYYPISKKEEIEEILSKFKELKKSLRTYEKTIQFNHCDERYNFYSKEIDGRFRFRISSNEEETKSKLSWKRRLKDTTMDDVNKEEEKEVNIEKDEVDNFLYIVSNVMRFPVVESYERYRTTYSNEDIEISIDEYPFGLALEIENKSTDKDPMEVVADWTKKMNLDINNSYRLSWDDKYRELCNEQGKEVFSEVAFDKDMPEIK